MYLCIGTDGKIRVQGLSEEPLGAVLVRHSLGRHRNARGWSKRCIGTSGGAWVVFLGPTMEFDDEVRFSALTVKKRKRAKPV